LKHATNHIQQRCVTLKKIAMGMMPPPKECHITGMKTINFPSSFDAAEYFIEFNEKNLLFRFHWDHKNSFYVDSNKHILVGKILNNSFPKEYLGHTAEFLTNEILERIIKEGVHPRTPEDKINNLLNYLHSLQEYEGSNINFPKNEKNLQLANRLYFKNYQEMTFYLFTLKDKGLITGLDVSTMDGKGLTAIKLTFEGLSKVIELYENGAQSDRCFIAMSFSTNQNERRNAIKRAITNAGYIPILIDEQHIESDVTINDALISEIRKAKFVAADFTEHKHGVYFEAGFALGLKKPVIYLCEGKDFKNTHFDTNHYPHIIYNDWNELENSLRTRIEAWIN
jgi:nucleoside 2-deoxyribosyltransferase